MFRLCIVVALCTLTLVSPAMAHEDHLQDLEVSTEIVDEHTRAELVDYQIKNAAEILGGEGVLNFLGHLDPLTRRHLFGQAEQVLGVTIEPFTKNLTLGMESIDVLRLQKFLNERGYTIAISGPGSKGLETTYFGPATAAAVKRYQEAHANDILKPNNLTSGTGLFLASTRNHLNKILLAPGVVPSVQIAATPSGVQVPTKNATNTYTLAVRKSGGGAITASNGQTCSTENCVFVISKNSKVTLQAAPAAGSKFVRWSGACSGSRTKCVFTMDKNQSIRATFQSTKSTSRSSGGGGGGGGSSSSQASSPTNYLLTAAVSGSGSVTGTGINCPTDCTDSAVEGASITLTAIPSSGHTFAGWTGACSGTNTTCVVSMIASQTVNASFSPDPDIPPVASGDYDLAVAIAGIPFSVSLPAEPIITSEVTATTEAEIIASLGVDGRRTIIVPGSYNFGSITVGGSNKEIIFQSGASFALDAFYVINASSVVLKNAVLNTSDSYGLRTIDSQDLRFEGLTLTAADSGFNLVGSSRVLFLNSAVTGYAHAGWIDAGNNNLVMANSEFISNQPWGGINGWSVRWSGNGTPNSVAMDSRFRAVQNVVLRYEESQTNGYFARNQIEGNNPFRTEGRDAGTPSAWPLTNLHFIDNNLYPLSAGDGSVIVSSYPRMTNVTATGNRTIGPNSTTNVGFPSGQLTWTLSGNTHTFTDNYETPPAWEVQ